MNLVMKFDCINYLKLFVVSFFLLLDHRLAFCQKTDFLNLEINHIWLPEDFLPYDISTYRSFVTPKKGHQLNIEISEELQNRIDLYSFKRKKEDYDLEVALILDSLNVLELKHSSHAFYRMPAKLRVRDYSNKIYLDTIITIKDRYEYLDVEDAKTHQEQVAKWNKYKRILYASWEGTLISEYIQIANHILEKKYSYRPYTAKHGIGIPKNDRKSSFDYSDYEKAFELIRLGFGERDPKDLNTGQDNILQAIKIWESKISLSQEDKVKNGIDKKIMYLNHLNCAVGYLWLPDFEKATENINLANEYKGTLSGGGYVNTRNSIEIFKKTFNQHPNWTGTRISEPRKSDNIFFNEDESFEKLIAINNEWMKENPVKYPKKIDPESPITLALINKNWKYQKIYQIFPDGKEELRYDIGKIDGVGALSNDKIRRYFNIDGTYSETNAIGEKSEGYQWDFHSEDALIIGMEIIRIQSLSDDLFVYKAGREGDYQVLFYMIPDLD